MFGILIFEPDINQKMKINNISSLGIMHKVEWLERKIDENKFVKYVKKVINFLGSVRILDSSSCSFCEYCKKKY